MNPESPPIINLERREASIALSALEDHYSKDNQDKIMPVILTIESQLNVEYPAKEKIYLNMKEAKLCMKALFAHKTDDPKSKRGNYKSIHDTILEKVNELELLEIKKNDKKETYHLEMNWDDYSRIRHGLLYLASSSISYLPYDVEDYKKTLSKISKQVQHPKLKTRKKTESSPEPDQG